MRGARDQRGRAELPEFLKGKRVDFFENVCPQVAAEIRDHLRGGLGAEQDAAEADRRDRQHDQAGAQDKGEVPGAHAAIEDVGHQRGQQQVAQRRHRYHQRGERQLAAVRFEIFDDPFHFFLS